MSENTPGFRLKARCFLPAWAALAALALLLSFISLYPLGEYGGDVPIRPIRDGQGKVLLVMAPVGFALVAGTAIAFLPVRAGKRFLISLACFLGLHSTVLVRHFIFAPLYVWCSGAMPNPISLAVMLASAGAATLVSQAISYGLERELSHRRIVTTIVALAAVIAILSVYLIAPYFAVQWCRAPAVLGSFYNLAWEMTVPARRAHPAAGFWFPSRQAPEYQASTIGPLYGPPSAIPLAKDALFLTEGFIARVRLKDGSAVWSREYDFGGLEQDGFPYADALAVWWQDDQLCVVNRCAGWDIFTFDWVTGKPLWEAKKPPVRRYRPNDPRATIVIAPEMIVTIPEDGKAAYEVIDLMTGATTRYTLPSPEGMIPAEVPTLTYGHSLGPYLIEGVDGTVAVLAFFAPPGASVTERLQDDGPPPDTSCLFGLDSGTGKIAWQIRDAGDWRSLPARFGQNFVVTKDVVVRWDTEPWSTLRAWQASTGELLWERGLSPGAEFLVSLDGAVAVDERKSLACFDIRTGGLRWEYEDPSFSDLSQLFLGEGTVVIATPSAVRGIRLSDGTEVFRSDAPSGTRLAAWGVRGGTVEVRAFTGSATGSTDSTFVDLRTGASVPAEEVLGIHALRGFPTTEGYPSSVPADSVPAPSRTLNGIVPVFKAEGTLGPITGIGEPRATHGSSGEVTAEGWVLLTSFDPRTCSYRVFMLEPMGQSSP